MKQYWITTIVCMVVTLICIVYIFKNIDKETQENADETTEDKYFLKIGRKDGIGFNIEINASKISDSILLIIIVLLLELIPIFNIPLALYSIFEAMLVVLDKKENE